MDKHVTAVAALFIAFGVLGVFVGLVLIVALVGGGFVSGDREAMGIITIVAPMVAGPIVLLGAAKIVGGAALLQRRPWARVLVLMLGFVSLLMIPIGTIYGAYAIWVLMKDDTVRLLAATPAVEPLAPSEDAAH